MPISQSVNQEYLLLSTVRYQNKHRSKSIIVSLKGLFNTVLFFFWLELNSFVWSIICNSSGIIGAHEYLDSAEIFIKLTNKGDVLFFPTREVFSKANSGVKDLLHPS